MRPLALGVLTLGMFLMIAPPTSAQKEKDAIADLKKMGAQFKPAKGDPTQMILASAKGTDASLAQVKKLTSLQKLTLNNTKITDDGMANLKELSKLTELDLHATDIGDAGIEQL